METTREKLQKVYGTYKERFKYDNMHAAPTITKVIINTSTGSSNDKRRDEVVMDRLAKITGQKPAPRGAKKSIATFKLREGDIIGYAVTLRGARMTEFIDKLIHVAIPRTRDFQGLSRNSIDEMGNYTMGVKEHTIFPETSDEDLKDVFGFSITFVTTAETKEEALALLEHVGLPLVEKEEEAA